MEATAQQILDAALRLPENDRAEIAGRLIRSLELETDTDVDIAWAVEIERRVKELESGSVKTVPWEEVRRQLNEIVNGHRQ